MFLILLWSFKSVYHIKDQYFNMERRKVCHYFERGSCRKDNCPFVHIKQNRKACTFYLEGTCRKGNSCNFYHPPKQEQKLASKKEELKNKISGVKNEKKIEQSQESEHQEVEKQQIKQQAHEQKEEDHHPQEKPEKVEQIQYIQPVPFPKIEQKVEQLRVEQKINKINFLLGLNAEEESSQSELQLGQQPQPAETIQFVKIFPKKFPDHNKTAQMKERIKQNEIKYFKGQKYIDLIGKITDTKDKEYYQIIRKFTDHFMSFQNEPYHFTVKIRPLLFQKQIMLHFEFLQETLDLQVDATKYPEERAVITILNPSIPKQYKQKFLHFINKYHQSKPLFETLKFVLNNFERIYRESHFKLQNQFYSRKQLQKKLKQQKLLGPQQKSQQNPKKRRTKPKPQKGMNPFVNQIKYKQGQRADHLNYSYQLTTQSMVLQNCQYVLIQKLLVYLQCVCQQKIMYIFDVTNDRNLKINIKLQCKKCHNTIIFGLEREVVQVRRQSLGRIGVSSGHLIDIGGVGFKIGCTCNNEISKGKIFLPGERITSNCHHCFQTMHVSYMGLKFYNPTLKIQQVRTDAQLPGKGTCKHVKLSFRWFRYGCCGRCFSCDDCHILESVAVHEKMRGITMLCGYCAREQPIGGECGFCHKQLLKGVDKTGHWEGGMGCRDQTALSRKDNKKYTGVTKKKEKEK